MKPKNNESKMDANTTIDAIHKMGDYMYWFFAAVAASMLLFFAGAEYRIYFLIYLSPIPFLLHLIYLIAKNERWGR